MAVTLYSVLYVFIPLTSTVPYLYCTVLLEILQYSYCTSTGMTLYDIRDSYQYVGLVHFSVISDIRGS